MDTASYLHSHGWLGAGHALHPTSGRGLAKPLLVAHKRDTLGVGKKKYDVQGQQWWMRALEGGLRNINVHVDVSAAAAATATGGDGVRVEVQREQQRVEAVGRWGAGGRGRLYGFFVRGEGLSGTIGDGAEKSGKEVGTRGRVAAEERLRETSVEPARKRRKRRDVEDILDDTAAKAVSLEGDVGRESMLGDVTTTAVASTRVDDVVEDAKARRRAEKLERRQRRAAKKALKEKNMHPSTAEPSDTVEAATKGRIKKKKKRKHKE